MVKLSRGGRRYLGGGRPDPMPLFPPGDLPVFGPPPANLRRPMPPPRRVGPSHRMPGGGFPPPHSRPLPPPPPHMRPPMRVGPPPPPFSPMQRRQGPHLGPPLRPLLQTPLMPPMAPFMHGGRGPYMGRGRGRGGPPIKRLGKNLKKPKHKRNKAKDAPKTEGVAKTEVKNKAENNDDMAGPWINDDIKVEIEKMNNLKKEADEKNEKENLDSYNEQKQKVESMVLAAKQEYSARKPDETASEATINGSPEQK